MHTELEIQYNVKNLNPLFNKMKLKVAKEKKKYHMFMFLQKMCQSVIISNAILIGKVHLEQFSLLVIL